MEGYCSTGQSPQWAVVPMEDEEEEEEKEKEEEYCCDSKVMISPGRDISNFKVGLKNNLIEENLNVNDTTLNMTVLCQTHHRTQDLKLQKNKKTRLVVTECKAY